jgi:hypothetical protein
VTGSRNAVDVAVLCVRVVMGIVSDHTVSSLCIEESP